jgi:hypothetical protein
VRLKERGILAVKALFALSAILFCQPFCPGCASQQAARPNKKALAGCKLVGTIWGTELWVGDCIASETGSIAADEAAPSSPNQAAATRERPSDNSASNAQYLDPRLARSALDNRDQRCVENGSQGSAIYAIEL